MSTNSRITDEDMRYFQFKARQHISMQKEDHIWNEFCKKNKCTCCSCLPTVVSKSLKDIGIQTASRKPLPFSKGTILKKTGNEEVSKQSNFLYPHKAESFQTVPKFKRDHLKININTEFQSSSDNQKEKYSTALYVLHEHMKNMVKKSLRNTLQKLDSSRKPLNQISVLQKTNTNKSYFLPHDLQKQRLIARNAYLSSLVNKPNVKGKKIPNITKFTDEKSCNKHLLKAVPKSRKKKSIVVQQQKDPVTLIELETKESAEDEHIEKVIDDIVEDLVGEEIIALNRIKQKKLEITNINKAKINMKRDIVQDLSKTSIELKEHSSFNLEMENLRLSGMPKKNDENLGILYENTENQNDQLDVISKTNKPHKLKTSKTRATRYYQVLSIDPALVQNVKRQRKLYWQFLEKTQNFDTMVFSNMVADSLIDDCISDICEELFNVPTFLISDLINQEFTETL